MGSATSIIGHAGYPLVLLADPVTGNPIGGSASPVSVIIADGSAAGGTSTYSAQGGTSAALLTNSAITVKNTPGFLYGVDFINLGTVAAFVQIFDLATTVTPGTTVPKLSKWVPAGGAWEEKFCAGGQIAFANGIQMLATTTPTGNTAPATGINANVTFV